MKKICRECQENKNINEFYFSHTSTTDGYQSICKKCDNIKKRMWYLENKKKADSDRKAWQKDNYELHLEHQRKYNNSVKGRATRKRHLEKIKEEREARNSKKER